MVCGEGSSHPATLLSITLGHPWLPRGAGDSYLPFPWAWDHHLPHPRTGGPPVSPISLFSWTPGSQGPPPALPILPTWGVPAAPSSTHCKFIIWVLWAFLEGPRVAELLDMVGFIETAGEGRGRA